MTLQADLTLRAGCDTVYFAAHGYGLTPQARSRCGQWRNGFAPTRSPASASKGMATGADTRDYAFAIGERRASEVRDFLVTQGIAPERMAIATWGKERPGTMRIGASVVGVGPPGRDGGALGGVALRLGAAQPGAGLALRFGNLAGGHLDRDFGAAFLAAGAARQRGEVEPFVRFDEVDRKPPRPVE